MADLNRPELDPELSLPHVQPETIGDVERDGADVQELYGRSFAEDEELALFVRRRARQLAPDDLQDRERIAAVALEVIEVERRQTVIDGLRRRWFGVAPTVKTRRSEPTDAQLPPAA